MSFRKRFKAGAVNPCLYLNTICRCETSSWTRPFGILPDQPSGCMYVKSSSSLRNPILRSQPPLYSA